MSNKMLIDASHQEETRVVVTRGQRIEEFDFESEHKKQIKGNIYLARVTRVEPSLQAAFIEYGGNRHGFLAFSEIHPDYYQIPVADRQALLEDEARGLREQDQDTADADQDVTDTKTQQISALEDIEDAPTNEDKENTLNNSEGEENSNSDENTVELVGAEDAMEEVPLHQHNHRRSYKIQEVIKKRQILLVQVVKEERGNKGAALTTYLSLAGRYSVLMPNTARGGGISRKIVNLNDRKRLKEIVKELEVPKGMGVILRTAGANRTRTEIKRDYEYLMRLWENVRNLTLSSIAPVLVHEEGNLIKRSIRDLYNKDIDEIRVAGEQAYREAKDFMRMLMPSHAKVVQPYRDPVPLFSRNGIELQLDRMFQPEVTLKSGGYLVMNQTEALVAIDVNSGRATKEHSVEETAVRTNLEAAEEVARQLRLRDLAGLVVIDFIDMAEKRNIRLVEKKLKECLKDDRARIQVGHISAFGLLEMSRQRLRASVLESTTQICPHCHGTGYVRSPSSIALHVIRAIEEYLLRHNSHDLIVHTPTPTALYVLNQKRRLLLELETRFGLEISIEADDTLGTQHFAIHQGEEKKGEPSPDIASLSSIIEEEEEKDESAKAALEAEIAAELASDEQEIKEEDNSRHRRDRKRRNGRHRTNGFDSTITGQNRNIASGEHESDDETGEDGRDKRRRRGRRAGRRMRDYNGRVRLPFAEPVGPFAASALAALRHRKRARYAPKAEAVGPFSLLLATQQQAKSDTMPQTFNVPAAEPVNMADNATVIAVAQARKDRRKPKKQPAPDMKNAKSELALMESDKTQAVVPLPPSASIASEEIAQETMPAKKRGVRGAKAAQSVHEAVSDTAPPEKEALQKQPKQRKATRKKADITTSPALALPKVKKQPADKKRDETKNLEPKNLEQGSDLEIVTEAPDTHAIQPAISSLKPENEQEEIRNKAKTVRSRRKKQQEIAEEQPIAPPVVEVAPTPQQEIAAQPAPSGDPVVVSSSTDTIQKPKRVGWWQRKSFF